MKPAWMSKSRYNKRIAAGKRRTIYDKSKRELVPVLDHAFSLWTRLGAAGANGVVRCCTCGKLMLWNEATLGHFVSRAHESVRFDVMNTSVQCVHCNSYRQGQPHLFRKHLADKYGEKAIQAMELRAQMKSGETAETLREKIIFYREQVKNLKKEKGL
jgi:hypothetical protein